MKTSCWSALFLLILSFGFSIPSVCAQTDQTNNTRKVINKVLPAYPRLARDVNLTGTVRLEVLVGGNGTAKSIEVKGGSPVLVQSAENALRSWRWEKSDHETTELVEFNFKP
jgi:outer membrane biosynthesis protein TonB